MPDITEPVPDAGHEQLRQSVVAALDGLADHVDQLADAFLLAQTAGDALGIALTNFTALQQALADQGAQLAAMQTAIDDLTARVTALENPTEPPTPAA